MKLYISKYLSLLLLTAAFFGMQSTSGFADESGDSLGSHCYECSCEPLYPCAIDIQAQGGISPIRWSHPAKSLVVNCGASTCSSTTIQNFKSFFHIPWTIGGQVGYALTCNVRLYAELNYVQAKSRSNNLFFNVLDLTPTGSVAPIFKKYRYYDFYMGARYYTDRRCDWVSFFVGAKLGLIHHHNVAFNNSTALILNFDPVLNTTDTRFFTSGTKVSGGANIGLDFCYCGNLSFVLTAEMVANRGLNATSNLVIVNEDLSNSNNTTSLAIGNIRTEISFPITAGLRYSF